ncbi:hypothetical protein ABZ490_51855 [Streptomyces sp. NPDC005811]|uniref:hypothetical protein n=1 Tax=Streptomyces sp. NPDC005811 TaxID=3154565 RepID=UPI0033CF716F
MKAHSQNTARQKHEKDTREKHRGTLNRALVTQPGGECTGATDGLDGHCDVFRTAMKPALTAIGTENTRAMRDGGDRYVTIAFLAPLTSAGKAKDLTPDRFAGEAEDAHTAIERADAGDSPLKIRPVPAHTGSGEQHREHTAESLKKVRNPEIPIPWSNTTGGPAGTQT